MSTVAEVRLWETTIGAVALEDGSDVAVFEYEPSFVDSGVDVAPITMPVSTRLHTFPELPVSTFHGLPGMLADSLPDRFGNAILDVWLSAQGRTASSLNAVERLCYIGSRGMGALEYHPMHKPTMRESEKLHIDC